MGEGAPRERRRRGVGLAGAGGSPGGCPADQRRASQHAAFSADTLLRGPSPDRCGGSGHTKALRCLATIPFSAFASRRQRIVGRVKKLKLDGSKRSTLYHYLRWTFVGAFAAMIVGVIGVGLLFLH